MGQTSSQTRRSLPHHTDNHDPLSDQAKTDCQLYANNNNVTCFPTAGTQVWQHEVAAVVCKISCLLLRWYTHRLPGNSRRPQIDQNNVVNVYLFDGDTLQVLFSAVNLLNPTGSAGEYNLPVNDSWFGTTGSQWQPSDGSVPYPFYWVITDQNGLDGSQTTNPTFFAVRMCSQCVECLGS